MGGGLCGDGVCVCVWVVVVVTAFQGFCVLGQATQTGDGEAVFPSVTVLVAVCLSVWEAQARNLDDCCWVSYCSRRLLSTTDGTYFIQPVFFVTSIASTVCNSTKCSEPCSFEP